MITLLDSLNQILSLTKQSHTIKIRDLLKKLAGVGSPVLLILFSVPFCLPIQIPGLSTPFGLILAFLGLRIALRKKMWLPRWILEKPVPCLTVDKIVRKTQKILRKMQKLFRPRLEVLTHNTIAYRICGVVIIFLALLLALPLPIPFTNLLTAIPILCLAFGLLYADGLFILIGYALALLCFTFFVELVLFTRYTIKIL